MSKFLAAKTNGEEPSDALSTEAENARLMDIMSAMCRRNQQLQTMLLVTQEQAALLDSEVAACRVELHEKDEAIAHLQQKVAAFEAHGGGSLSTSRNENVFDSAKSKPVGYKVFRN